MIRMRARSRTSETAEMAAHSTTTHTACAIAARSVTPAPSWPLRNRVV
jgi:hypothetical protein